MNKTNVMLGFGVGLVLLLGVFIIVPLVKASEFGNAFLISEKTEYGLTTNTIYINVTENLGKDQTINVSSIFQDDFLTNQITYTDFKVYKNVTVNTYGFSNTSLGKYSKTNATTETIGNQTLTVNHYYLANNTELFCDYVLADKSCLDENYGINGTKIIEDFGELPSTKEKIILSGLKIENKVGGIVLPKNGKIQLKLTYNHPIAIKEPTANKYNITVSSINGLDKSILDPTWWNGTGGTITYDGNYTVVKYTSNGTFVWEGDALNASVLVIGGGGGSADSGGSNSGGGGGGGYVYNATYFVSAGSYNVVVGAGGIKGVGANSSFGTLSAYGGGTGAVGSGVAGGSGGGAGGSGTGGTGYQGNAGGNSASGVGAGGGGAGTAGVAYNGAASGGRGGNGTVNSINGTAVYYAGGGGGIQLSGGGIGGLGGGGNGANLADNEQNGVDGLGGGGGGTGWSGTGSTGGSGVVIIRYLTSAPLVNCTFAGYVKQGTTGLQNAQVVIFNQDNKSEIYNTTTDVTGYWVKNISNSTKNFTAVAYFNSTKLGSAKPFISGTC